MKIEPLGVPDAWVCTPAVHGDDRGFFLEWLRTDKLAEATGRRFEIQQANHSLSARGVTRGLHFADTPPGQAKLVYCPVGSVLDVIVDLRVGSPTFGAVDTVLLSAAERKVVFVSEGLGHGFCSLEDGSSVNYLVSTVYNPVGERTICPTDPELGLPWPTDLGELSLSAKDAEGPTLAEAREQGILPDYQRCQAWYAELATH
jgi:dTDP-4-dehydrorhamnose 3,5-epimerase